MVAEHDQRNQNNARGEGAFNRIDWRHFKYQTISILPESLEQSRRSIAYDNEYRSDDSMVNYRQSDTF